MGQGSTAFNQRGGLHSLLALTAIGALLAGCGGPTGPTSPSSAPSSEPASSTPPTSSAPGGPESGAPPSPPAGWTRYSQAGFSISAPSGFTPDPGHDYQALGPGKDIKGFALTIPASLTKGTNLGADSYIAVETLPGAAPCTAAAFLDSPAAATEVTTNGITYSVATANDAGAGNFYDETVYAVQRSTPCLAVRSFIHSTNIGNYDPGTVKAFDRAALIAQFDAIRATLTVEPAK